MSSSIHVGDLKKEDKDENEETENHESEYCAIGISLIIFVLFFPFAIFTFIKFVKEYERAVILRLGKNRGAKGPGLFFILTCIDEITIVDLRTKVTQIVPQEVLTKDSVTVKIDGVLYFRIIDPVASVFSVENAIESTQLLAATSLRNVLGTKTLNEILLEKEVMARMLKDSLDEATHKWGISVERIEIKDVRLPINMQRSMALEAQTAREARAKIIAAEGEQKASLALKIAAETINVSPAAIQLRYLQSLTTVAKQKNSTVICPIPTEFMKKIMKKE